MISSMLQFNLSHILPKISSLTGSFRPILEMVDGPVSINFCKSPLFIFLSINNFHNLLYENFIILLFSIHSHRISIFYCNIFLLKMKSRFYLSIPRFLGNFLSRSSFPISLICFRMLSLGFFSVLCSLPR